MFTGQVPLVVQLGMSLATVLPARLLVAGGHGISILGVSPVAQDFRATQMCSNCSDLAKATSRTSGFQGGKAGLCFTELWSSVPCGDLLDSQTWADMVQT